MAPQFSSQCVKASLARFYHQINVLLTQHSLLKMTTCSSKKVFWFSFFRETDWLWKWECWLNWKQIKPGLAFYRDWIIRLLVSLLSPWCPTNQSAAEAVSGHRCFQRDQSVVNETKQILKMDWGWKQARGHATQDGVFIHSVEMLSMTLPASHQAAGRLMLGRLIGCEKNTLAGRGWTDLAERADCRSDIVQSSWVEEKNIKR